MRTLRLHQILSILAMGIWFASLMLPTLGSGVTPKLGLYVLREGAFAMLIFFLAPIHMLSWCTNIGFFVCGLLVLFRGALDEAPILFRFLCCALTVNTFVGLIFGRSAYSGPGKLDGLLALPGFYVWILSFVVMVLAVKLVPSQSESK